MHKIIAAAALAAMSFSATAAPIELNLTGTVTTASGSRVGDLGSAVTANLIIDLDYTNAARYAYNAPAGGESAEAIWYFIDAPYRGDVSGNWGLIGSSNVDVATLDNWDADSYGNPYGLTGVVDVFSIFVSNQTVDCTGGTVDPITGCDIPDAPVESGEEFGISLVGANTWFSGLGEADMPGSIPDLNDLIGAFSYGTFAANGAVIGENEMEFTSMTVTTVPIPAAVWMFGSGLGLLGWIRRKQTSKQTS